MQKILFRDRLHIKKLLTFIFQKVTLNFYTLFKSLGWNQPGKVYSLCVLSSQCNKSKCVRGLYVIKIKKLKFQEKILGLCLRIFISYES